MTARERYDAVVVGAGPNGLSAAVRLARAGHSVLVIEGRETIGGGARSAALTEPGFVHDICSAIHPLGIGSPWLSMLPLEAHGLEWVHPEVPLAHPLDGGDAVVLDRSLDATAEGLGSDGEAWRRVMAPLVERWDDLLPDLLGPPRPPRHPLAAARVGLRALRSASGLCRTAFGGERARALFAGLAGHSMLPLEKISSAAIGVVLGAAGHAVGWPMPRGGAQRIVEAMAAHLRHAGGEIVTGRAVTSLRDLPPARAVLLDVSPRALARIAGDELPEAYRARLDRFRYGPGVFKIDWALDGPIPWQNPDCARAGTVHVGGPLDEIAASERDAWRDEPNDRPFVLLAQPTLFDPGRAPEGRHVGWAYCHVPHGSTADMTGAIEAQVERFAPGFRDRVIARATMNTAELEAHNPNCIGGDITGGVTDLRQIVARPTPSLVPYATPNPRIFLCSSSTPPGAGVHGMCGFHAAETVLRRWRRGVPR
jgi:phytoene dehydrogenase-like protein